MNIGMKQSQRLTSTVIHLVLAVVPFIMVIPFVWMVLTAFKTISESTFHPAGNGITLSPLSAVSAAICSGDCHHRGEVVRVPPFVSGSHIPTQVHNNIFGWCFSIQYTRRYL